MHIADISGKVPAQILHAVASLLHSAFCSSKAAASSTVRDITRSAVGVWKNFSKHASSWFSEYGKQQKAVPIFFVPVWGLQIVLAHEHGMPGLPGQGRIVVWWSNCMHAKL